jgi:hypothetical protein
MDHKFEVHLLPTWRTLGQRRNSGPKFLYPKHYFDGDLQVFNFSYLDCPFKAIGPTNPPSPIPSCTKWVVLTIKIVFFLIALFYQYYMVYGKVYGHPSHNGNPNTMGIEIPIGGSSS